jgi:hypothetical protein
MRHGARDLAGLVVSDAQVDVSFDQSGAKLTTLVHLNRLEGLFLELAS